MSVYALVIFIAVGSGSSMTTVSRYYASVERCQAAGDTWREQMAQKGWKSVKTGYIDYVCIPGARR